MSAAKSEYGTLDTTDYVLLDYPVGSRPGNGKAHMEELARANELCAWGEEYDVDGWIRMEAGFEIIYCDFSEHGGLDLLSAYGNPLENETIQSDNRDGLGEYSPMGRFEWLRAAAARYHGHPPSRVEIDFSGMVSLFSYSLDLWEPDSSRSELPRANKTSKEERQAIRARLGQVMAARKGMARSSIKWQSIVDNIISHYSGAIRMLADDGFPAKKLRSLLASLLNLFKDYPHDGRRRLDELSGAIKNCGDHYLILAIERKAYWTLEDQAIFEALHVVSKALCTSLFTMRDVLEFSDPADIDQSVATIRTMAKNLMTVLGWTTWKECGPCPQADELCFVPMFPMGSEEDYRSPACRTDPDKRMGYWRGPWP
ncbi:hypothetical protein GQ53DRAFT_743408 [Thozetella sp. PMI_491]|nr:hypothetical protein GQ53DRAFT_743408 [Thozetella sp. PMI_491]